MTTAQNKPTAPRGTTKRFRRRLKHRHIDTYPGIDAYLADPRGQAFIDGCLYAISYSDWGLVSSSEAAANERARRSGGHIVGSFLMPDDLCEEQVLLIDVTNAGTRHSRTSLRLLDPTVGVAA